MPIKTKKPEPKKTEPKTEKVNKAPTIFVEPKPTTPTVQVKVKCENGAKPPVYAHKGDSGFDFVTLEKVRIYPGQTVIVKTGLYMEIPEGYELQVRPRSGLSAKSSLRVANSPGTIDSSYRGEIGVILWNAGSKKVILNPGEKIAQGVICPVFRADFKVVGKLDKTTRGEGGFGSTGVKTKEVK